MKVIRLPLWENRRQKNKDAVQSLLSVDYGILQSGNIENQNKDQRVYLEKQNLLQRIKITMKQIEETSTNKHLTAA